MDITSPVRAPQSSPHNRKPRTLEHLKGAAPASVTYMEYCPNDIHSRITGTKEILCAARLYLVGGVIFPLGHPVELGRSFRRMVGRKPLMDDSAAVRP